MRLRRLRRFPNRPDIQGVIPAMDAPIDIADDYGMTLQAWFVAPEAGSYTFYLSSDDDGQLRLSIDDRKANAKQILWKPRATGHNKFHRYIHLLFSFFFLLEINTDTTCFRQYSSTTFKDIPPNQRAMLLHGGKNGRTKGTRQSVCGCAISKW